MESHIRNWMTTLAFSGALFGAGIVVSEDEKAGTRTLTVSEMVGRMANAEQMFERLDFEIDFRDVAVVDNNLSRVLSSSAGDQFAWPNDAFAWANPSFQHAPLYFEQAVLERYGWQTPRCLQPALSAVHFYGSIASLPIHWFRSPPHLGVSTSGHFRPGTCALGN